MRPLRFRSFATALLLATTASASALPDWVPAPGRIANINLNNLSDINPCPSTNCWFRGYGLMAPWRNWSGAVFAPQYSENGAIIFNGGGHGGGRDWGLYVFDFSTRLWARTGPAMPLASPWGTLASPGAFDPDWYDTEVNGSRVVDGLHTYNMPAYIPPDKPGAGSRGSWFLPFAFSPVDPNGNPKSAPHAVDLVTGLWTRATTTTAPLGGSYGPYSGSIEDTNRGVVIWSGYDSWSYSWVDLNQAPPRTLNRVELPWQFYWPLWYGRFIFVPEANQTVGFGRDSTSGNIVAKLMSFPVLGQAPVVTNISLPASAIAGPGYGIDWNPHTRRFYLYSGGGSGTVVVLTPDSLDFATCTWTWSEETFTGATPAWTTTLTGGGGEVTLGRWRYVPPLRSFSWSDGIGVTAPCVDGITRNGVMQLWRPLGTDVPAQQPAWRRHQPANTWTTVTATNTLAAIDPAQSAAHNASFPNAASWRGSGGQPQMLAAWSGAILDPATDTFWIPIGGGHGDYGGNEPYRIRLDRDTPGWEMVRPPTGSLLSTPYVALLNDGQEATGTYADGRIRAIHSYNKATYVPGTGPFLAHNGGGYASGNGPGEPNKRTFVMNESTGEWTQAGTHGTAYVPASGSACTYDPSRHAIWYQPQGDGSIRQYNFATQAWTDRGGSHGYCGNIALTYIPGHDLIALNGSFGDAPSPRLQIFNASTNIWTTPALQGTPPAGLNWTGNAQPHWVPALGALCLWNNDAGTTVIATLTPTGNPRTDPWQWGTLPVAAANTITPTSRQSNGTYGRFQYSPRLDGFYLINAVNQPVYFYALGDGNALLTPITFATWQAQQTWGGADSSETADPDADSLSNLTEYALRLSPLTPDAHLQPASATSGGSLTLTYTVDLTKTDITWLLEVSPDLVTWSAAPTSLISQSGTLQTWTASVPAIPDRRFLRLRITR
jgi:hypothetical protein